MSHSVKLRYDILSTLISCYGFSVRMAASPIHIGFRIELVYHRQSSCSRTGSICEKNNNNNKILHKKIIQLFHNWKKRETLYGYKGFSRLIKKKKKKIRTCTVKGGICPMHIDHSFFQSRQQNMGWQHKNQ